MSAAKRTHLDLYPRTLRQNITAVRGRLFVDAADSSSTIDAVVRGQFRSVFSAANTIFDNHDDSSVDAIAFGRFRVRSGASV
jgi:hypothetical protein